MNAPLYLRATSLFSKWGFDDGDALSDWYWDATDGPLPPDCDDDDTLEQLIRTCLIPAIEAAGHTVELKRIETIHNPIRARTIYGDTSHPKWADDITVTITLESFRALTEAPR